MVPKLGLAGNEFEECFRAVLFRMVPKLSAVPLFRLVGFRAVLFRMVPKPSTHGN